MSRRYGWRSALLVGVLLAVAAMPAAAGDEAALDARAVFEKLKTLEGSWTGTASGTGEDGEPVERPVREQFRVSGAGSVVMEIMFEGSEHEMINMYHLDGDDLLVTHYCAGGNQPQMKLDTAALAEGRIHFDFIGGTNLDPAADPHIHSATLLEVGDSRLESSWGGWMGGKPAGETSFVLERERE